VSGLSVTAILIQPNQLAKLESFPITNWLDLGCKVEREQWERYDRAVWIICDNRGLSIGYMQI
jgi:hypothetical protein